MKIKFNSLKKEFKKTDRILSFAKIVVLGTGLLIIGIYLGWKGFPGFLKANYLVLTNAELWKGLSEKNDLETLNLDLKFQNYQKLNAKRSEALKNNRLVTSEEDFVKATLSTSENSYKCEIRLKGDLSDHWNGDKWSLRVKMKEDKVLWGMSRFSLQKPGTRLNTAEWLFQKTLRDENLIGLKYKFINLRINGKSMGIFALEEHFSKEMIEKNKRREGVIVSFGEYRMWNYLIDQRKNLHWDDLYRISDVHASNSNRVARSEILSSQKSTAVDLLLRLQKETVKGNNIFSPKRTGKFLALSHLFNAEHGLMYDDMNFYFDPVTCLLEPIGFDANCETNERSPYSYFTGGSTKKTWFNHILKSPAVAHHYIFYLNEFSKASYIHEIKEKLADHELKIRRLLLSEILGENASEIWYNYNSLLQYDPWESFNLRAKRIQNDLSEPKPILCIGKRLKNNSLEITVRNALKQPVEILGFGSKNSLWNAIECINEKKSSFHTNYLPNKSIFIPAFDFQHTDKLGDLVFELKNFFSQETNSTFRDTALHTKSRIFGLTNSAVEIPIPIINDINEFKLIPFAHNSCLEGLKTRNSFITEQNNTLYFKSGTHFVKGDLFIPSDFDAIISPGCSLLFEENATFISRGRILAIGLPNNPILISGSKKSWGGLLLSESAKTSIFENVFFKKMSGIGKGHNPKGIFRSGWNTTGGITIHSSEVKLRECVFENSYSEDALNIISSNFLLENSTFRNLPSDGFDGDFVEGTIRNCKFENIGGDGIDFSGSIVETDACYFFDIKDKAVSVGESSNVKLSYLSISNVKFGIVSKDSSKVEANHTTIRNATKAAIAAYQKKNIFGPSEIVGNSISIVDSSLEFLVQNESRCFVDGTSTVGIPFESSELY